MESSLTKLSTTVNTLLINQKELQSSSSPAQEWLEPAAKEISQAADRIKAAVNNMRSSIAKVTNTITQLASTASTYKDALLNTSPQQQQGCPGSQATVDPRIIRDIDRKSKEILINTMNLKILGLSQLEIKDKVRATIKVITNPPPLQIPQS